MKAAFHVTVGRCDGPVCVCVCVCVCVVMQFRHAEERAALTKRLRESQQVCRWVGLRDILIDNMQIEYGRVASDDVLYRVNIMSARRNATN